MAAFNSHQVGSATRRQMKILNIKSVVAPIKLVIIEIRQELKFSVLKKMDTILKTIFLFQQISKSNLAYKKPHQNNNNIKISYKHRTR
jgi:hypothetical protein